MNRTHWIIMAALLALPSACALSYVREFLAVDSALDAGASYNYRTGRADFTQSHPYVPFAERHGAFLTVSACSAFGAVGYAVAVAIWRRRKLL